MTKKQDTHNAALRAYSQAAGTLEDAMRVMFSAGKSVHPYDRKKIAKAHVALARRAKRVAKTK